MRNKIPAYYHYFIKKFEESDFVSTLPDNMLDVEIDYGGHDQDTILFRVLLNDEINLTVSVETTFENWTASLLEPIEVFSELFDEPQAALNHLSEKIQNKLSELYEKISLWEAETITSIPNEKYGSTVNNSFCFSCNDTAKYTHRFDFYVSCSIDDEEDEINCSVYSFGDFCSGIAKTPFEAWCDMIKNAKRYSHILKELVLLIASKKE